MLQEYLYLYILFNLIGIVYIFISFKYKNIGRLLFVIFFIGWGIFNLYGAKNFAGEYLNFATLTFWPFLEDFILNQFQDNLKIYLCSIAIIQILIGILLTLNKKLVKAGIIAAIIGFLMITPLGIGSAFPFSLFMIIALVLLFRKNYRRTLYKVLF